MGVSKKGHKKFFKFVTVFAVTSVVFAIILIHFIFPSRYLPAIRRASGTYGVEQTLIQAVIWTESKYKAGSVSSKGAKGLMQMMPNTARWVADQLDLEYSDTLLFQPEAAIEMGVFYLRYLLDKFSDERLAVMAYNAGEGNVQRWILQHETESIPFPETKHYIKRVKQAKAVYRFKAN